MTNKGMPLRHSAHFKGDYVGAQVFDEFWFISIFDAKFSKIPKKLLSEV